MSHKSGKYSDCTFLISNQNVRPFFIKLKGRNRWALERLIYAGKTGCTPIHNPAPRWAAYVFNLRRAGVQIETLREQHSGDFSGNYARYILRSVVEPTLPFPVRIDAVTQRKKRFLHATFAVTNGDNTSFNIVVMGHDRWALELLIKAGETGCNPIDCRLPRWFENITNLRILGLHIETRNKGYHTYHILHSTASQVAA